MALREPSGVAYRTGWKAEALRLREPAGAPMDDRSRGQADQRASRYRQDFNTEPLSYWRANDAPDRQGITEIGYVTGYLAYWDELRRRHPNMRIDSCAGGGRRNDLETMRRAVPLTRSDYLLEIEPGETVSQQSQTYGIALWIPYFGTGINGRDAYTFRSQMCPALAGAWDMRLKDIDYASLRRLIAQRRTVANEFYGDYYLAYALQSG